MKLVSHRGYILYVPAQFCLPRKVSKVQEAVYHHLANQIMARESVKVVDAEVQLAVAKLIVRNGKTEGLVKHGVEIFAVDARLELLLPLWQQVDLHVRVSTSLPVYPHKLVSLCIHFLLQFLLPHLMVRA